MLGELGPSRADPKTLLCSLQKHACFYPPRDLGLEFTERDVGPRQAAYGQEGLFLGTRLDVPAVPMLVNELKGWTHGHS